METTPLTALRLFSALAAASFALTACSGTKDPPHEQPAPDADAQSPSPPPPAEAGSAPSPRDAAVSLFWQVYPSGGYARITELDRALSTSVTSPDGEVTLLRGLLRLWRLSEWGRDLSQDQSQIPAIASETVDLLGTARTLRPDDDRIHGWLGPTMMAIGRATADSALVAKGVAELDQGVAAYPEFNLFVRGLVSADAPRTDASFAAAVDAMWQNADVCAGERIDRTAPDYSKYMGRATSEGRARVCWNGTKSPHNFEGFFLHMGDLLTKSGDSATAAKVYANARLSSTYAGWAFREELERRLADAPARAALYGDADPSNDPPLFATGAAQCMMCHAK